MVENYWRPSFILRLILIWLTILFVLGWLPMLRGAFDGPSYEWGNSYFGKQFSGKGTAGDYWFLIVQAALGILILFLGWRGARPHFSCACFVISDDLSGEFNTQFDCES